MGRNVGAAHWLRRLLSVARAMACELLFSRDFSSCDYSKIKGS